MMPTNRAFHPTSSNNPLRIQPGFSWPDREADRIAQLKDSIEDWEQIPGELVRSRHGGRTGHWGTALVNKKDGHQL